VRRLVAGASVFDNAEKGSMVYRLMVGLAATGVRRVLMMPAGSGLSQSLERVLRGQAATAGVELPQLDVLEMPLRGTGEDTLEATRRLAGEGVAAIAVLGGDGTSRLVASACGDVPLCPLSTGTNNAFPEVREATAAGLALGLVATGAVGAEALRREKCLRVDAAGRTDTALVDVARTAEPWVGSRALWRPEAIAEAVVAFGEPGAVGLSALASLLDPIGRTEPAALHVQLARPGDAPTVIRAPIAPGLVAPVGVRAVRRVAPGEPVILEPGTGSLALDGEREVELRGADPVQVTLDTAGPLVVDVRAALTVAAKRGLLVSEQP
jgi:predicted polyphosphate/ATP-dependent NAD kinase